MAPRAPSTEGRTRLRAGARACSREVSGGGGREDTGVERSSAVPQRRRRWDKRAEKRWNWEFGGECECEVHSCSINRVLSSVKLLNLLSSTTRRRAGVRCDRESATGWRARRGPGCLPACFVVGGVWSGCSSSSCIAFAFACHVATSEARNWCCAGCGWVPYRNIEKLSSSFCWLWLSGLARLVGWQACAGAWRCDGAG